MRPEAKAWARVWRKRQPGLTPVLRETLELLAVGHSVAEIARIVGISVDGVKWRLRQAYRILGARGKADAVTRYRSYTRG